MLSDAARAQLPPTLTFVGLPFVREGETELYHWRGLTLRVKQGTPELWWCDLLIRFAPAPHRKVPQDTTIATHSVHVCAESGHHSLLGVADHFALAAQELAIWEGIASTEREEQK